MKPFLVHLHIYYKFLFDELCECLKSIGEHPYDLVITLVENDEEFIKKIKGSLPDAKIMVVENLGFDLGPFIKVISETDLSRYSYIIKLHTKRDVPTVDFYAWYAGSGWRRALLKFIRKSSVFERVLANLENNSDIGMHGPNIATYNKLLDEHKAHRAVDSYIASKGMKVMPYRFVAGTMFMVKASVMKTLVDMGLTQKDFEDPDLSHEGLQTAHIFERMCGYAVYANNLKIADCTHNLTFSKFIYTLIILRKIVATTLFTVRITTKNKLLVKVLKIPVLSIRLKDRKKEK